jgi:amino acid adenylation domain-containing protein
MSSWHVQRLLYQFESVLVQLHSATYIRNVAVFSEQDRQLVRKWNAYEPGVVDDTVPSLFLERAKLQPDAIAISAFDGEFTYAELGLLASQFAQELVKLGAGPEHLVPICLDKSRWATLAVMAVLCSGAGYVPLSPGDPASRHLQIVKACKASIVLCSPSYGSRFVELVNHVFSVSETAIRRLPACPAPLPLRAKSNNVCYVTFTSDSTGIPKGLVVEHKSITSSAAAICEELHITPTSRVFQFCSFPFDVAFGKTLATLIRGATIYVPSDEKSTTDLASAVTALGATWACLTPSVASTLEGRHAVSTLNTLVAGGEPTTSNAVKNCATGVKLQTGHVSAEASAFVMMNDQISGQRDPSKIGHVLNSGRAWLTNPENPHQLAPVGATAELCLEGPLLARGYLNDPEQTAEAFIDDPAFLREFSNAHGSRTYRTGDIVHYAPDGSIHYIGRKDNQVKLAGQSIELGEIEQHLQSDDDIREVVVQLPKNGPCMKQLTAVVSFASSNATNTNQGWHILLSDPETGTRINHAKDRLVDLVPSYMVPTIWIAVPRIPSLPSTKFDKKRIALWLEEMDDVMYQRILETERSEDAEEPVNDAITTLRGIWAKVLNCPVDEVKPSKSWLCKSRLPPKVHQSTNKCQHLVATQLLP